jgi:hypothetical protein
VGSFGLGDVASGVSLGDRMGRSVATFERGRLRTVGDSRELGRCCQDKVPERARPALPDGGFGLDGSGMDTSIVLFCSCGERPGLLESIFSVRMDFGVGESGG